MDKEEFFGKGQEELKAGKKIKIWDWENFQTTEGFPVSENLLDWVIGQDNALKECYLCLDEWVHKLKWMKEEGWFKSWENPEKEKLSKMIPPGPYLLLLGDAGTGKSLIGRAMASYLTELYKKENIQLYDVVCWENKLIPSEPNISCHEAGKGKEIVKQEKIKVVKKNRWLKWAFRLLQGLLIGFGIFILASVTGFILWNWIRNPSGNFLSYFFISLMLYSQLLYLGIGALFSGAMLFLFKNLLGKGLTSGSKGISGAEQTEAPKLIVDNSRKVAPFIDATGHGSAQLFGSIAWDPLQTGGLGTPEHQRTSAGDVHKANLGILYIDEIKNLQPQEAITLLTVLEDGQLSITLRGSFHGSETSAMAVSSEPVPCLTFLLGAGNFDSINMIHPALMDRIYGYGKVVRMNNDMPNSIENRRKYIQFISQEIQRFHLLPFSREACIEVINEGRRRSNKSDRLSTKFRPLIAIIKTAATLAVKDNSSIVEKKHVIEAIEEHCLTIQKQILDHIMKERGKLLDIEPKGKKLGVVYGLAVVTDNNSQEMTGSVLKVKAHQTKINKLGRNLRGYYKVTGIAKGSEEKFISDSVEKVRSVILQKYGIDIAQEYLTHLDFSQSYGVDGPSAGVTMALALCSLIEGKPLRQDIAVTGEINIGSSDEVEITAVGGVYEKIKAAERWGFKKVIIPEKNYKYSVDPKDFKIQVLYGKTLDDYLKYILEEEIG